MLLLNFTQENINTSKEGGKGITAQCPCPYSIAQTGDRSDHSHVVCLIGGAHTAIRQSVVLLGAAAGKDGAPLARLLRLLVRALHFGGGVAHGHDDGALNALRHQPAWGGGGVSEI